MLVETLPIHFAPLQGYTEAIYRNAHATVFGGVETYYTPFVRLEKETFRSRDIRDIEPGNNTVSHLIPQLIGADTNKAEAILSLFIRKDIKKWISIWDARFRCWPNGIMVPVYYPFRKKWRNIRNNT